MEQRYEQLDSLRGIAAMLVFIFHTLMILPNTWKEGVLWKILNISLLHHLFIGDKRVIFFFILSGFVLSLPFIRKKRMTYPSFIIKRIVRLYIPYAAAITFAIIACIIFSEGAISELGQLFNAVWMEPANLNVIIGHYLFLGNYNVYAYNISIWSLIHELRISFIFPFLMIIALRYGWKTNLAVGLGLAIIGAAIHLFFLDP
ncbi:acyltransferase family protein, partial [Neobacillus niacini]|uniref:acyltransferase family protein n=1 Tax=Neobacillus niacini TaxID=86668 RepID=UPI0030033621